MLPTTEEMASTTLEARPKTEPPTAKLRAAVSEYFSCLTAKAEIPWNSTTYAALAGLVLVWAALVYGTWATWGNLSIDCGREMYVPATLAEGKMLYRDVWYLYGPAAPYVNSFLYRLFGIQLNVLYWAGSLSALGSAIFLYVAGMRMSSRIAGWTAGSVLLLQAFHRSLFCFPLPYSFASVYGCLTACAFLWLVIRAATSKSWLWIFSAGIAAAVALLLKFEFGAACYAALLLLIALRAFQQRSWKFAWKGLISILPGVAVCGAVIGWMISINGIRFLVDENLAAWPTSYFMKVYGKSWLDANGLSLSWKALGEAAEATLILIAIGQGLHWIASPKQSNRRVAIWRMTLLVGGVAYLVVRMPGLREDLSFLFFPQALASYVAIAACIACWYFLRQSTTDQSAALTVMLFFCSLLAVRVLVRMSTNGYSIYYNAPVVLCFLLLIRPFIPRVGRSRRFVFLGELAICLGCLTVVALDLGQSDRPIKPVVALNTERGTIKVSKSMANQYQAAIKFMKDKNALGESVLSVPEDTSLYFLSGTHCPTRVCTFTPGIVVPGKMADELIREIDTQRIPYLIWSNRIFPEYGVPVFGVNFDRPLGTYLKSHYRRVELVTDSPITLGEWNAYIWERVPDRVPDGELR
jgi:hypothetical protein